MSWGPKWKHRPCPCGCGEMADECMSPTSGLNAFQIVEPVSSPLAHDRDFEANLGVVEAAVREQWGSGATS